MVKREWKLLAGGAPSLATRKSLSEDISRKVDPMAKTRVALLVGTMKGAFILESDASRAKWKIQGPHFLGAEANHLMLDPWDRRTLVLGARTGHLGPTVFRSSDWGKTWKEATQPPAFPKVSKAKGRSVKRVFWLTPGHSSERNTWYAGTSPHGLFRSNDGGENWEGVAGFNDSREYRLWTKDSDTPAGPLTHSILVDPRDKDHLYLSMSGGGTFESANGGKKWRALNKGVAADFLPSPDVEYGHDPHCVVLCPNRPDRLYQQNHCGIYRLDRPGDTWERIGNNMPKEVGDIGFPIVTKPTDPDSAWVFPMDGSTIWPRTSPGGKPSIYRTRNAGQSWKRCDRGLPKQHGYLTVYRHGMTGDPLDPMGLYFGTSSGEVWASRNEGDSWERIAEHLPRIIAVEAGLRA